MGTPPFAAEILRELLENGYALAAVFTQPDKKIGRKQEVSHSAVKKLALEQKIKIYQPASLKNGIAEKILREIAPDLVVVAAYGKILPAEILEIPRRGCLNVHASLLPKFRGASPIQNAIFAGESETGVTLMLMSEKMDAGEIVVQEKIEISQTDTTETLTRKLAHLGAKILATNLPHWISGKMKAMKQDEKMATYCRLVKREDGIVNWGKTAEVIYNQWRAFQPWPGISAAIKLKNTVQRIKLNEITFNLAAESGEKAGKVIRYNQETAVQTGHGLIVLKKVQLEGKKSTDINNFLRGHPDFTLVA